MATQLESDSEVGVTTLISGIVQDARDLFVEQMTLFQVEIKNDHRIYAADAEGGWKFDLDQRFLLAFAEQDQRARLRRAREHRKVDPTGDNCRTEREDVAFAEAKPTVLVSGVIVNSIFDH